MSSNVVKLADFKMEKLTLVNYKNYFMGIDVKNIDSFSNEDKRLYVNLKNGTKFKVENVLSIDFTPYETFTPKENFYKITGANFISKFFTFKNKLGFIINIKNFTERLNKNETG